MELIILSIFLTICIFTVMLTKRTDLLEPINFFIILYLLFFILRPFSIIFGYSNPFGLDYNDIIKGMLIGLIGFISFVTGYYSPLVRILLLYFRKFAANKKTYIISSILLVYNFISFIGIFLVVRNIGFSNILSGPIVVAFYLKKGSSFISYFFRFSYVALLISLSYLLTFSKKTSIRVVCLISFVSSIVASFIIGVRGFLAQILLSIFFLYFYSKKKILTYSNILNLRFFILFFVFLLLVYAVIIPFNIFRNYGFIDFEKIKSIDFIWNQIQAFLIPFDWFAYVNKFNETIYFKNYLYSFLNFIPRSVWRDKPVTSVLYYLTEKYVGDPLYYPTYTLTIIGDLHLNLPYIGVIVFIYGIGIIFNFLYKLHIKYNDYLLTAYYVMFLTSFIRGFYTSFQTWFLEGVIFNTILFIPFIRILKRNV